jgi:hypothetical protein
VEESVPVYKQADITPLRTGKDTSRLPMVDLRVTMFIKDQTDWCQQMQDSPTWRTAQSTIRQSISDAWKATKLQSSMSLPEGVSDEQFKQWHPEVDWTQAYELETRHWFPWADNCLIDLQAFMEKAEVVRDLIWVMWVHFAISCASMMLKCLDLTANKAFAARMGLIFMLSSIAMTLLCIWKAWGIVEVWATMAGAVCSAPYDQNGLGSSSCQIATLNDIVANITSEIESAAKVSSVTGGMNTVHSIYGILTGCALLIACCRCLGQWMVDEDEPVYLHDVCWLYSVK